MCFTKYYRHYLHGRKFTIGTNHGALHFFSNFQDPKGQVTRWLKVLGTCSFEIQHLPGLKHNNLDALSQGPCRHCERDGVCSDTKQEKVVTRSTTRAAAEKDTGPLGGAKSPLLFPGQGKECCLETTYAVRADRSHSGQANCLEAGRHPPHVVLKAMHYARTAGHMGVWSTLASVRNRFFLSWMWKNVTS